MEEDKTESISARLNALILELDPKNILGITGVDTQMVLAVFGREKSIEAFTNIVSLMKSNNIGFEEAFEQNREPKEIKQ